MAPAVLAQYKNALNVERAKRTALALNLSDASRALLQVQQEAAALAGQGKIATAEAAQSLAALEQEAAEHDGRSATRITAPAAGTVTAFGYSIGQSVQAGTVLAAVLPAGTALEAQLLIPSRAKSAVAVGQQVQLRIDSFPYQKFGLVPGTITQVELNPINDGPQPGAAAAASMCRATVALSTTSLTMYGKRHAFEPGLTLEADIFNDPQFQMLDLGGARVQLRFHPANLARTGSTLVGSLMLPSPASGGTNFTSATAINYFPLVTTR